MAVDRSSPPLRGGEDLQRRSLTPFPPIEMSKPEMIPVRQKTTGSGRNKTSPQRKLGPLAVYEAAQEKADSGPSFRWGDVFLQRPLSTPFLPFHPKFANKTNGRRLSELVHAAGKRDLGS